MPSARRLPPRQAGSLLHRQGQERSGARLRLFRGGAGTGAAAILLTRDEAQRIRGELRQAAELSGRPLNHYDALGTTVAGLGDLRRSWHDTWDVASRFTGVLIS
jgi:hypothetical protein